MGREDVWRVRDDRTLSWAAKLVWLMLESRGEDCRPSVAVIAADCGITKPTVRKARAELVAGGWLKESTAVSAAGDSDSNSYLVTVPRWGGKPPFPPPPGNASSETGGQAPCPPGWSTTDTTVVKDVDHGGKPPFPKEEKGSVKGKCKKTSKPSSSEQSPDVRGARPEVDRICDHLADRVEQLTGRRPPITITGWLRPARYLLDTDLLDEKKIHAAIEFAAGDEFWAPNIRSVSKLRDKLPQLRAAADRKKRAGGGGNRHQQNQAATEAYLAAVDEYESRTQPERKAISS